MQNDEVVISANVHNYLKTKKIVQVSLDLTGGALASAGLGNPERPPMQLIEVLPDEDKRVDWRVRVLQPGTASIRVSARTDEESDAMSMDFPVYIHGMLKTETFSRAMRSADKKGQLAFVVPHERLPDQSRIEIRYSPSIASAMVDALPYLIDYPYGCSEQTLNRFLPTVITQKMLLDMNLDLEEIQKKRTNLNAHEVGDDAAHAADWRREEGWDHQLVRARSGL